MFKLRYSLNFLSYVLLLFFINPHLGLVVITRMTVHKSKHLSYKSACCSRLKCTPISMAESRVTSNIKNQENITDISMGLSQLKPFLKIATPFFREDKTARNSLLGVIGMTLLNSGVSVAFSYISRDFYNSLNARDEAMFYEKIELFFAALLVAVPVSVYYRYLREKLALYWREALTAKVLEQYYSNRTFFVMETLQNVDNPDQRISDDIRAFTRTSLDFLITLLTSVIDLFSFSAILFQIYPGLFLAIIVYAGVGTIVTTNLGRSLVGLNYDRLQREANFRFALIRTRENAEAIAFYDRDARLELEGLWTLFRGVLENQLGIVTTQRNLEYFTTSYRYLVQVLPSLIVAPLYFAKKLELGAISQSYGAFNHILGDFSLIINSFESLSAFSAGLTRLTAFLALIEEGGWDMASVSTSGETDGGAAGNVQLLKPGSGLFDTGYGNRSQPIMGVEAAWKAQMARISMKLVSPSTFAYSLNRSLNYLPKLPLLQCSNLTVRTPDGRRVLIGNIPVVHPIDDYVFRCAGPDGRVADVVGGAVAVSEGSEGCGNDEFYRETRGQQFRGIDLTLPRGSRVLVVGPSGAGKSSFIRAIAGLWEVGNGRVSWTTDEAEGGGVVDEDGFTWHETESLLAANTSDNSPTRGPPPGVFFLPQKPYNFIGTLRQQIQYPCIPTSSPEANSTSSAHKRGRHSSTDLDDMKRDSDGFLRDILAQVRLEGLVERVGGFDAHWDWSSVLSLGEQQRLAFARVIYNNPGTVVLDEATSALDLATEQAMYDLLIEKNMGFISVGHRPSLLQFHSSKLVISGPGKDVKLISIEKDDRRSLDDVAAEHNSGDGSNDAVESRSSLKPEPLGYRRQ